MVIETKTDLKSAILHNIQQGRSYAIAGQVLANRLGERDTRTIRLTIQELIKEGYPIIGTNKKPYGYFMAETPEECKENLDMLMSYLKMIATHHKYMLKASGKLLHPEQLPMRLK